jgi:putative FmdB family regulatory protein
VVALTLNLPGRGARISSVPARHWSHRMPHYEFFCHNCKKLFSKILSLVDYEEGEVLCPHCGSKEVEQCWSAFSAITSKKSA